MSVSSPKTLPAAAPFWMSLVMVPLVALAAIKGGFWWMLMPAYAWYLTSALDGLLGSDQSNADPETALSQLFWHRAVTIIWFPL